MHQKLFNVNEFNWDNTQNEAPVMRQLTKIENCTSRDEKGIDKYLNWIYPNPKFFQEAFSINLINEYVSRPNNLFGTPSYDQALRIQCDLLQIFLVFHL